MDNEIINDPGHEVIVRQQNQQNEVRNPDAFDVGQQIQEYNQQSVNRPDTVTKIITNPNQLMQSLDLTEEQLDNVMAMLAGLGAGIGSGMSVKHLSKTFGPEFAGLLGGALGGLLGGYAGKKITRGRRTNRRRYIE